MLAIGLEVTAAIAARFSERFTELVPTLITISFAVTSYISFALSLKHGMNIGIGYSIWAGIGVLSVAIIGAVFLGDSLTLIQFGGMLLIISGLAAVQLGGKAKATDTQ